GVGPGVRGNGDDSERAASPGRGQQHAGTALLGERRGTIAGGDRGGGEGQGDECEAVYEALCHALHYEGRRARGPRLRHAAPIVEPREEREARSGGELGRDPRDGGDAPAVL